MTTAAPPIVVDGGATTQSFNNKKSKQAPLPSWLPGMDDIRAAHLAQASALESIVAALASKQQSSISSLKRQINALTSAQANVLRAAKKAAVGKNTGDASAEGKSNASDRRGDTTDDVDGEKLAVINPNDEQKMDAGPEEDAAYSDDVLDDVGCDGMIDQQQLQQAEEVAFLACRVAALEKDMVKLQGMWDMNKGQRVIEVWMALLNKKSYKPRGCEDPEECAVITLQNWWRDMLVTRLGWNDSGSSSARSYSDHGEQDGDIYLGSSEEKSATDSDEGSLGARTRLQRHRVSTDGTNRERKEPRDGEAANLSKRPKRRRLSESTASPSDSGEDVSHNPGASIDNESESDSDQLRVGPSKQLRNGGDGRADDEAKNRDRDHEVAQKPNTKKVRRQHPVAGEDVASCVTRHSLNVPGDETTTHRRRRVRRRRVTGTAEETGEGGRRSMIPVDPTSIKRGSVAVGEMCRPAVSEKNDGKTLDEIVWPDAGTDDRPGTANASVHHHGHRPSYRVKNSPSSSRRRKRGSGGHHTGRPESEGGGSVQGMFDGAIAGHPVLMITSMAMQLQSLETEVENLREQVEGATRSQHQNEKQRQEERLLRERRRTDNSESRERSDGQITGESMEQEADKSEQSDRFRDLERQMNELQRELHMLRVREEEREGRNELSLKTLEALIAERGEESSRQIRAQTDANEQAIGKLLQKLDAQGAQEKSEIVRHPLIALKLELRSMYASLAAISGNEVSANLLRELEGIRNLLTRVAERGRALEQEIGDPTKLARSIVAEDVVARRFADMATDLGTTVFAFVKAQILQARRAATHGSNSDYRRSSTSDTAAVVAAKMARGSESNNGGADTDEDDDGSAGTTASPEAWAKLSHLTFTRDGTGEALPFPAGMAGLLQAISNVLNHCVGTGDLAIRLSVTLEDLTLYVAQRADKERETVIRQLGAPIDGTNVKLSEMEETLAGFQRTMHLVLGEVEADKQRAEAIKALGASVEDIHSIFGRVRGELKSKVGASEIEAALEEMTSKIHESANNQSRLQRLAHTLGKDHNSSTAIKRLQIELEQARSVALLALAPSKNEVLIGSKCLSCNRPLGGFASPPQHKVSDEWYTGAGSLRGPKDRVLAATPSGSSGGSTDVSGSSSRNSGGGGGGGTSVGNIGTSRAPGQTQPVITPGTFMPDGAGTIVKPAGPILFERTGGNAEPAAQGLKGRGLRSGTGPGMDWNLSVSKYPRLVPLTAAKSAPAMEKLYHTAARNNISIRAGGATTAASNRRRYSSTATSRAWSLLDHDTAAVERNEDSG